MKTRSVALLLIVSFFLFAGNAFAQGNRPSPRPTPVKGLSELRLRACEAKQNGIKTRITSLVRMAENMEKVFDSIADRVKMFYQDKVIPSGKTLSNYDALVADIAAKKAIVDSDLASVQTSDDTFNCTSGDPKTLLNQFRLDMQKVKADLKNYRTSIRNLIVAVRRLAPAETPSPTASATATPVATPVPTVTPTATP